MFVVFNVAVRVCNNNRSLLTLRTMKKASSSKADGPAEKKPKVEGGPIKVDDFVEKFKTIRKETAKSVLDFDFKKKRVRILSDAKEVEEGKKGIVYWMSRDARVQDNWAFLFAQKLALKNELPLHVCFSLVPKFLEATIRHYKFMLKGLEEVSKECQSLDINFHMLTGMAKDTIPKFVKTRKIGAVVCDLSPLRVPMKWVEDVRKALPAEIPLCQVDAHNIVPLWVTSEKQEYAARTIRNKVNNNLNTYLSQFPPVIKHPHKASFKADPIDWAKLLDTVEVDRSVDEVAWATPGYIGGIGVLQSFVEKRLRKFNAKRNDPTEDALSNLSPWFHFGQISVQRCILAVKKYGKGFSEGVAAFCEEAIVRRELSDNFCFYNKNYDSLKGAYDWAQKTLDDHRKDKRTHVYSRDQLEQAKTHDDLWNSAQIQMVKEGKMHGFLRMYWAKKILEWTKTPEEALDCAPGNPITCVPSRPEVACVGRPDGIIPHPDACNRFIVCSGGSSSEQSCPVGQILRPEIPACVTGDSDTCEFLDGICIGRPDRYVFEHPNYCGMFIWCLGGQALALPCPEGEILRPDMQFCVPGDTDTCEPTEIEQMCEGRPDVIYPHPDRCDQYIRCNQGNLNINQCGPYLIVQPGTIDCVPGNTDTCELYVDLCRGRPDGIIPHPSRCHLFIECRSGQVNTIQCPEGHIFDSSESRCVPGNTETCDHLDEYCLDRPDGVIPHPNRCDLFMMCSDGVTSVHSCPWGEILRPDMQFCVPGDKNTCQFAPVDRMCDDREGPLTYPHPDDCSLMVRCNQGQVSIVPCQEGTVLQPGTMQCVAGNADTCKLYIDRCVDAREDVISHPSQCHLFMQCIGGQALVGSCARGMVFINGQCVIGDRVACESWQQVCGNMADQIIEHPNFCDLYIECRWGTTSMRPCSTGLILHPNMQVCTPGDPKTCEFEPEDEMCVDRSQGRFPLPDQTQCTDYVTCSNGIGTVGTCQDGTVLRPRFIDCVPGNELTCEAFPHICLFRPNEYIPHPIRCDLFVSCISEIPHVMPCQRGEIFDMDRGMCVPGDAESCLSYGGVCTGREDMVLEHPHHCDLFIVCASGNATVHPCPPGEILVPELQFCFPGNVETCELHTVQDMCVGSSEKTFPHPENCNQFIQCVDQSSAISPCPDGKIYQPSTGSCVPGNAQNCELYNERCKHHENGVIEFPTRCDLFLLCSSGLTTAHPCPEGEILNADIQLCTPGDRNTCTFYDVSTTTTEPTLQLICENIPDGRYSHPFLCNLFIECTGGQAAIQSCPSGSIWISDRRDCAPGDWSTCTADAPPQEITNDICVRTGIYVIPHPFVCYKYIQCVFRVAFVEECARWHIFSARFNLCIPGDRNNC